MKWYVGLTSPSSCPTNACASRRRFYLAHVESSPTADNTPPRSREGMDTYAPHAAVCPLACPPLSCRLASSLFQPVWRERVLQVLADPLAWLLLALVGRQVEQLDHRVLLAWVYPPVCRRQEAGNVSAPHDSVQDLTASYRHIPCRPLRRTAPVRASSRHPLAWMHRQAWVPR